MSKLRDSVFEADDLGREDVHVPEWGGGVDFYVVGLTAAQRNAVIAEARAAQVADENGEKQGVNLDVYYARTIQLATHDPEDDSLVFSHNDLGLLLGRSPKALDRLSLPALRLSGMDQTEPDKQVGDAGKDLPATLTDDSSSNSQDD